MDINKALREIEGATPTDVGTMIMHYVVNNFEKKSRMKAIRDIIRTFGVDFLSHELEPEDREVVRSLNSILEKQLKKR